MSEMPFLMAQCRSPSCGWIGPAHERMARDDPAEALFCPRCLGATRSWVLDQAKEQASLQRLEEERSQRAQVHLDGARQSRLASEGLKAAKAAVIRCQAHLSLAEIDDPANVSAVKQALLAAEQETASAFVAHKEAQAAVHAR